MKGNFRTVTRRRLTDQTGAWLVLLADPCRGVYCRAGRVCKPNKSGRRHGVSARGRCVCADADHCASTIDRHHQQQQQRHHLVCGSDGSWYPSHCELHRIACISGVHISVDRSSISCSSVSPDTTTRSDKTTSGLSLSRGEQLFRI